MTRLDSSIWLPACGAGLLSGLLLTMSMILPLALVFQIAAIVVMLLAGFRYGHRGLLCAVVAGVGVSAILVSPLFAFQSLLSVFIPAGWISHLANLARPASELGGPDDLVAWYPLSDIIYHICLLCALLLVIQGTMVGYGVDFVDKLMDEVVAQTRANHPELVVDAVFLSRLKKIAVLAFPTITSMSWVGTLFFAYYIATRILNNIGQSLRPRDDIPAALRMNAASLFTFLGAIILCFMGGVPAMVGATIAGGLSAGFLMSGFAMIHYRTIGKDWRLPALLICYLSSLMTIPAFFIMILGLCETRKTIALTPRKNQNPL